MNKTCPSPRSRLYVAVALFALSAAQVAQAAPTGQYFGRYQITMNSPVNALSPAPWRVKGTDTTYMVLGWSEQPSFWLWDFDKKTISVSGGTLWALNSMPPPYALYSPTHVRDPNQKLRSNSLTPSDLTGELIANADGTYTVRFAYGIYLQLAGWPQTLIEAKVRVEEQADGTLKITTLDEAPDSVVIPQDFFPDGGYNAAGSQDVSLYVASGGSRKDGIPGVIKPSTAEDKANGAFPFRVSPQWDSERMVKIDATKDSNKDAIPDAVALALGLNPYVADTDGDGISDKDEIGPNWQEPVDTDQDGIPDVLEPGDAAKNFRVVGNAMLANNERVTVQVLDGERFGTKDFPTGVMTKPLEPRWKNIAELLVAFLFGEKSPLPEKDADGVAYNYDLGRLTYHISEAYTPYATYTVTRTSFSQVLATQNSLAVYRNAVTQAQATYDADPTDANKADLDLKKKQVADTEALLAKAIRLSARVRDVYRQRIIDHLGIEFLSVTTYAEFMALITSKGIDPEKLRKNADVRITFHNGIPKGLKLFWTTEFGALAPLPADIVPSRKVGRAGSGWSGVQANNVPFEVLEDGKTIKLGFRDNGYAVTPSFVYGSSGTLDATSSEEDFLNASGFVSHRIVLAHTETARPALVFTDPNPPATNDGGSDGGGGGALDGYSLAAGLLALLGLGLPRLRQRFARARRVQ